MSSYRLQVTTRSPLVLADRHAARQGVTSTLDYIPGTVLRGAIAAALLRHGHTATSTLFQGLFESGKVHFGNLYPIVEDAADDHALAASVWPVPVTAWSCKLHPGFHLPNDASSPHGVVETLTDQLTGAAWQSDFDACRHEGCLGRLEPFSGYCERDDRYGNFVEPQVTRRLITRTAISDRSGLARDGALFSVEAIEEEQVFVGFLHITDPNLEPLHLQLRRMLSRQPRLHLRLGLGRSRGYGEIDLEIARTPCSSHLDLGRPLAERWRNDALDTQLHTTTAAAISLPQDHFTFVITLYADAILLDNYGRYCTALDQAAWDRILRLAGPPTTMNALLQSVRYLWGSTGVRRVRSWRFAPGRRMPTTEELAVRRGSVFVFRAADSERDAVLALLQRLEDEGIGRRRDEGFGRIIVGQLWQQGEKDVEVR